MSPLNYNYKGVNFTLPLTQQSFYRMSDSQINLFGNQLSRLHELSYLANQGESYEELAIKIKDMLRDQQQQKQLFPYLKNLGFKP